MGVWVSLEKTLRLIFVVIGMNLEKRTSVRFCHANKMSKRLKTNKFLRASPVSPDSDVFEVVSRRTSTIDKIPVQELYFCFSQK